MLHNKKGAALLQVLLVTVILAGLAAMLLRASLSRSSTARKTRREVTSQLIISSCQAEVNSLWSIKSRDVFVRDLEECWMVCPEDPDDGQACDLNPNSKREYECNDVSINGVNYAIKALFTDTQPDPTTGQCPITYEFWDKDHPLSSTVVL
ncbi:MAG: type II secretion system protein [Elusimicrobiaceae bacterium]|nr:type II secretion system protein [Elusimicrobiaceae bacterium]